MIRCDWANSSEIMKKYHDEEWGVPVHDDRLLFEHLTLDTFQAGLSWAIILNKRENFREAFDNFDPEKIVKYDDDKILELLNNKGIIRNKLKIQAAINNARKFLEIKNIYGSFDNYIWKFTGDRAIVNKWKSMEELPATSEISDKMSKDMKNFGFRFTGSTVCYAFMQTVGMVNDHITGCFRHKEV